MHRYGGDPVGAFTTKTLLTPSMSHAMFVDQTHDNPSAVSKRSAEDMAATGAIVAASCGAIGSNRGYDELVPYHVMIP